MEESNQIYKRQNRSLIVGALVVFIGVFLFTMFHQTTDGARVETQLDAEHGVFGIGGTGTLLLIPLDEITAVEIVEELDVGQPVEAEQHDNVIAGKYSSEILGTYTIYADKNSVAYVVIRYAGECAVFGSENRSSVKKAYLELTDAINLPAESEAGA